MTQTATTYGFGVSLDLPYADAIERAREALKSEGFGILTEIDIRKTLKEKIDADVTDYVILGACNPQLAHRALQAEPEIGLLLPCNVIVYATSDGRSRIAVMDPATALGIVDNPAIQPIASEARERLKRAVASLERGS